MTEDQGEGMIVCRKASFVPTGGLKKSICDSSISDDSSTESTTSSEESSSDNDSSDDGSSDSDSSESDEEFAHPGKLVSSRSKPPAPSTELVVYEPPPHQVDEPEKTRKRESRRHHHSSHRRPASKSAPRSSTSAPRRLKIRRGSVNDLYKVYPKVIGTGAFGTVRSCANRRTKARLAVKSILKKVHVKNAVLLKNEISLLQRVNHPNVIHVEDVIEDCEYIHIVMEECKGGDLFDKLIEDGIKLEEARVGEIIGSLLDAVAYLHSLNIIHRDLKAEHIMLSRDDINSQVKIIDFGLAVTHNPDAGDAPLTAFAGSPFTVAPEVIKRSYGKEIDLWSVGVITYFLFTHLMPFNAKSDQEIFKKIKSGQFSYPRKTQMSISSEAKDFIASLLVVDPKERLTAKKALCHPWIVKYHQRSRHTERRRQEPSSEERRIQSSKSPHASQERTRKLSKPMAADKPKFLGRRSLATAA
jgi:calcium-dependent protein kinase